MNHLKVVLFEPVGSELVLNFHYKIVSFCRETLSISEPCGKARSINSGAKFPQALLPDLFVVIGHFVMDSPAVRRKKPFYQH